PGLTTCPECKAVRFEGQACGSCGWRPTVRPQSIDVEDGDLDEVDRRRVVQARARSAAGKHRWQLAWIAPQRGYRWGWVAAKFREKFNEWPPRGFVEPEPPSDEVRAWVRSRQIAYARALEKSRGAA